MEFIDLMVELAGWLVAFVVCCAASSQQSRLKEQRRVNERQRQQLVKAADKKLELLGRVSDVEIDRQELREKLQAAQQLRPKIFDPQGRDLKAKSFRFCSRTGVCDQVLL